MKITIFNSSPRLEKSNTHKICEAFAEGARSEGAEVEEIFLARKKIHHCIGCFDCWLKTPGLCSIRDDEAEVSRRFIAADHVIFASPLIMGFPSALLKNAMDRNICIVHPHLEDVEGEVHHKKRYDRYPVISYLLEKESATDDEDIAIASDIFRRQAVNMWSSFGFIRFTDTPEEEIIDAIALH